MANQLADTAPWNLPCRISGWNACSMRGLATIGRNGCRNSPSVRGQARPPQGCRPSPAPGVGGGGSSLRLQIHAASNWQPPASCHGALPFVWLRADRAFWGGPRRSDECVLREGRSSGGIWNRRVKGMSHEATRCAWARTPLSIAYHDAEWGSPVHDDRTLFEFLILEGAQAGLSWETILKKRDSYRSAFGGFDPAKVARFKADRIARLLTNPGIVRNRLKVNSAVTNAKLFLSVQREFGTFDKYVWSFVGGFAARERAAVAWRHPTSHSRVGRAEPRSVEAGLQVCRLHHLLRVHAGRGHGRRPHGRLFSSEGRSRHSQIAGSTSPIARRMTTSARSSNCVGSAFTMTTRAPAAFASGTAPATG